MVGGMTDKELLELAAKAAGFELDWYPSTRCDLVTKRSVGDVVKLDWNPLTDDGDALRLAVKLKLRLATACNQGDQSVASAVATYIDACVEDHGDDPYEATRRCITRAAAEIGKE